MKISNYFIFTYKNIFFDIKYISNKYLFKSGFINQLSNGIFIFFPICFKLIKNICFVIKNELEKLNFIEFNFPIIQPLELFKISNRFLNFNLDLFNLIDRKRSKFILSPTNEEIIVYVLNNKIKNFKCFPIKFYQIGLKFRDELRAGYGLIRSKEFLMKDAYSFFINIFELKKDYESIYNLYISIFNKFNIKYKIILSQNDIMGGYYSHEFYLFNDIILYNDLFKFSNFLNLFNYFNNLFINNNIIIFAPNIENFFLFSNYLKLNIKNFLKFLIFFINDINNKIFLKIFFIKSYFVENKFLNKYFINSRLIKFREINLFYNLNFNYINIKNNIKLKIYIDKLITNLKNFIISLNKKNYLFKYNNLNFLNFKIYNKKNINYNKQKIEIAHIFQLGDFYSKKFEFKIKNKYNKFNFPLMNCYGIGISRLLSGIVECNYDNKGIIWPINISPFKIVICPLGYNYINIVKNFTDKIYSYLKFNNIDIIIDDRMERLGLILNDWDLIGIPYKIIISEKNIKVNKLEYIYRKYLFSNLIDYINFKKNFIKKFNL